MCYTIGFWLVYLYIIIFLYQQKKVLKFKYFIIGLSNKENNWTIRLAIQAIKQNIPVVVVNVTMNGITKIYHPERGLKGLVIVQIYNYGIH